MEETTSTKEISEALKLRFKVMEIVVIWEGVLRTNVLRSLFHVERLQASRDIDRYRKLHPGDLLEDRSKKGYVARPGFVPRYCVGDFDDYLDLCRFSDFVVSRDAEEEGAKETGLSNAAVFEFIPPLLAPPQKEVVTNIMKAIESKGILKVIYASDRDPVAVDSEADMGIAEQRWRYIVPTKIFRSGYNYHVRAFSVMVNDISQWKIGQEEPDGMYKNFDLNRFQKVVTFKKEAIKSHYEKVRVLATNHPENNDTEWNARVELKLGVRPGFSPDRYAMARKEYGIAGDTRKVKLRAPLIQYALDQWGIDYSYERRGEVPASDIILRNLDEPAVSSRIYKRPACPYNQALGCINADPGADTSRTLAKLMHDLGCNAGRERLLECIESLDENLWLLAARMIDTFRREGHTSEYKGAVDVLMKLYPAQ